MKVKDTIARLIRLQAQVGRIQEKLGINAPKAVLYLAPVGEWDDRQVVVESDGFGGATTSIVEGNYPIDYLSHYAKKFDTEETAVEAAEAIVEQHAEPKALLA